jgi:YVTN family beta-propeller protein
VRFVGVAQVTEGHRLVQKSIGVGRRARATLMVVVSVSVVLAVAAGGVVVWRSVHGGGCGPGTTTIEVGNDPVALAAGKGSIWVANHDGHSVSRIDPVTAAVVADIEVAGSPAAIAVGDDAVWVIAESRDFERGMLSRIDPATNRATQVASMASEEQPLGVVAAQGSAWVLHTEHDKPTVSVVDTGSERVVRDIPLGLSNASSIAFGSGALWVTNDYGHRHHGAVRVDIATDRVTPIDVPDSLEVCVGPSGVWISQLYRNTVTQVDPATGAVIRTVPTHLKLQADGVAVGEHEVWLTYFEVEDRPDASPHDNRLLRLDSRTGTIAAVTALGAAPGPPVVDGEHIWVANREDDTLCRVDSTRAS